MRNSANRFAPGVEVKHQWPWSANRSRSALPIGMLTLLVLFGSPIAGRGTEVSAQSTAFSVTGSVPSTWGWVERGAGSRDWRRSSALSEEQGPEKDLSMRQVQTPWNPI